MPGSFDFIHLKRHTKGSSNEISFDVLDAARDELDSKGSKRSVSNLSRGSSRGSYHGVAGTSTLSSIPEVEKRKHVRQRRLVRFWVGVIMIALAAIAAISFLVFNLYQGKVAFSGRLDSLASSVEQVDESIMKIDKLMEDPFSQEGVEERANMLKKADSVDADLDSILDNIAKARAYAASEQDSSALDELEQSVEGRKEMVSTAKSMFKLSDEYQVQLKEASYAWTEVVKADQQAREATAAANRATTEASTSAAKELTQEAQNAFNDALFTLENAQKRREGLDFSAEIEYINKRIEALSYALATSDALLAGDREAAAANNEAYNKADIAAVNMAATLPLMLDEIVNKSYEDEKQELLALYEEQRAQVVEADATVRTYLGD